MHIKPLKCWVNDPLITRSSVLLYQLRDRQRRDTRNSSSSLCRRGGENDWNQDTTWKKEQTASNRVGLIITDEFLNVMSSVCSSCVIALEPSRANRDACKYFPDKKREKKKKKEKWYRCAAANALILRNIAAFTRSRRRARPMARPFARKFLTLSRYI